MTSLKEFLDSKNLIWGYTEDPVPLSFSHYQEWLSLGFAGPLNYLQDQRAALRENIKLIFPNFSSALVFIFPYSDSVLKLKNIYQDSKWNGLKIGSYSFAFGGYDYHHILKQKLTEVVLWLKENTCLDDFKIAIDTHPILERDLAKKAGLGVLGVNSLLIHPVHGSYFMIGSILCDAKMPVDLSLILEGDCGNCGACPKLCPAEAISSAGVDASKCFSTFSIETFKDVQASKHYKASHWLFGCDRCQEVCPWNVKALKTISSDLTLTQQEIFLSHFWLLRPFPKIIEELQSMSNSAYAKLFKNTSFERTGRIGMLKNLIALSSRE